MEFVKIEVEVSKEKEPDPPAQVEVKTEPEELVPSESEHSPPNWIVNAPQPQTVTFKIEEIDVTEEPSTFPDTNRYSWNEKVLHQVKEEPELIIEDINILQSDCNSSIHTDQSQNASLQRKCLICGPVDLEIVLFPFPKKEVFIERWKANLNVFLRGESIEHHKVCGKHFEDSCFKWNNLKFNAVPTLLLGNGSAIHRNTLKYNKVCSAEKCLSNNSIEKMRFFKFPQNLKIQQQWINILKVKNIKNRMFACMLHFDESLWVNNKLPINSLPTSDLPTEAGKESHRSTIGKEQEKDAQYVEVFEKAKPKKPTSTHRVRKFRERQRALKLASQKEFQPNVERVQASRIEKSAFKQHSKPVSRKEISSEYRRRRKLLKMMNENPHQKIVIEDLKLPAYVIVETARSSKNFGSLNFELPKITGEQKDTTTSKCQPCPVPDFVMREEPCTFKELEPQPFDEKPNTMSLFDRQKLQLEKLQKKRRQSRERVREFRKRQRALRESLKDTTQSKNVLEPSELLPIKLKPSASTNFLSNGSNKGNEAAWNNTTHDSPIQKEDLEHSLNMSTIIRTQDLHSKTKLKPSASTNFLSDGSNKGNEAAWNNTTHDSSIQKEDFKHSLNISSIIRTQDLHSKTKLKTSVNTNFPSEGCYEGDVVTGNNTTYESPKREESYEHSLTAIRRTQELHSKSKQALRKKSTDRVRAYRERKRAMKEFSKTSDYSLHANPESEVPTNDLQPISKEHFLKGLCLTDGTEPQVKSLYKDPIHKNAERVRAYQKNQAIYKMETKQQEDNSIGSIQIKGLEVLSYLKVESNIDSDAFGLKHSYKPPSTSSFRAQKHQKLKSTDRVRAFRERQRLLRQIESKSREETHKPS